VIAGVIEQKVDSLEEVMEYLALGNRNRKTEATLANQVSSRSHAVLQLTISHSYRQSGGKENVVDSKLSLIDLAGSER
jgi:kinesin family protein 18/19